VEVGKRLSQKAQGGVVGRFGGDEFILILPNIKGVNQVKRAISEIISAFKAPLRAKGIDIHMSPSVGVSLYPKDGTSFDELVRYADVAMYRAKRSGAGSYRFFE
jgi:diguanylate cyclase (GGDEF)-like protein